MASRAEPTLCTHLWTLVRPPLGAAEKLLRLSVNLPGVLLSKFKLPPLCNGNLETGKYTLVHNEVNIG